MPNDQVGIGTLIIFIAVVLVASIVSSATQLAKFPRFKRYIGCLFLITLISVALVGGGFHLGRIVWAFVVP